MLKLTLIEDSRGAFRSILVLKAYSMHAYNISTVEHRYRPQIGGLALATAAVCGFTFSESSKVHGVIIHPSRSNADSDLLKWVKTSKLSVRYRISHSLRMQAFAVASALLNHYGDKQRVTSFGRQNV
jgi:hypothetical protein